MSITFRKLLVSIIGGLLLVASICAEHNNPNFLQIRWTTEKGLPQNSVNAIAQTPDGYLWMGTLGGLASFDGNRFKNFSTDNTPEIKDNRISALIADEEGTLWIGTESGEIIQFKDRKFIRIDDGKRNRNAPITSILADKNNNVLVGSKFGIQICRDVCSQSDFNEPVQHIRQDAEGNIWFLSRKKLFRFQDGKFIRDENISEEIIAFEPHLQNGFWVVKDNEFGLYQNGIYKSLKKLEGIIWGVGTSISKDGKFWLDAKGKLFSATDDKIEESEIQGETNTARCLFIDQEGDPWVGRSNEGLLQFIPWKVQNLTDENGQSLVYVNSLVEDRNGNIWIATENGLYRWKDEKLEAIPDNDSNKKSIARSTLLIDRQGTLWNNTELGLQSYRDGKFTLFKELSPGTTTWGNALFEDSKNNLWYGHSGSGAIVIHRNRIIAKYSTDNGLAGNVVSVIAETHGGDIWLGTTTGLSRLREGTFTNFTTKDGLSSDYIRDIYEDHDGTIWIGTYNGLNRYKNGRFTPITAKNGLFDDIVLRILVDDDDNFWMLGSRGIFSVNRQMLNDFADGITKQVFSNSYPNANGMISKEGKGGYQWAGTRTSDGKFWFPTVDGVIIIDPKQEKLSPPKPIIEEVLMEKDLMEFSDKLELDQNHEDIEIHYTAISFRKPEQMRFRSKIEGLDDDWEDVESRRVAYFPRLPFGEYRFQVIAANPQGGWSKRIAELQIVVYPPFYRTWWFYSLVFLAVFLIIFSAYRYRNWQIAHEKALREDFARNLLKAQEAERRRIAAEIHDNLGQQLLIIKNWATYCLSKTSKTSKIRPQINQIGEIADEAINEVRSMAKALSPYHLDKAGLTNTIRFMVKQVAESCDIRFITEIDDVDGVLPKDDEINLYRIVQESVNNIVKHSNATEANVSLERIENKLILRVSDNGIGFNDTDYQNFGTGLNGIAERARMLGGNLSIKSVPKKGTQIILEIALRKYPLYERN